VEELCCGANGDVDRRKTFACPGSVLSVSSRRVEVEWVKGMEAAKDAKKKTKLGEVVEREN